MNNLNFGNSQKENISPNISRFFLPSLSTIMEERDSIAANNRRESRLFRSEEFESNSDINTNRNRLTTNQENSELVLQIQSPSTQTQTVPVSPESPELIPDTPTTSTPKITVPSNDFEFSILGIEEDIKSLFENVNSDGEDETIVVTKNEFEIQKSRIKQEIIDSSEFYKKHWNNQILLKEESYLKFAKIKNFGVGYRYENLINKMGLIQLLTQYVNESNQIRFVCRKIYFIECGIKEGSIESKSKLLKKLISNSELVLDQFRTDLKLKKEQWYWILSVYRQRYLFVKEKLKQYSELDGLYEVWRKIHDYEVLYDFCCNFLLKQN